MSPFFKFGFIGYSTSGIYSSIESSSRTISISIQFILIYFHNLAIYYKGWFIY